MLDSSLHDWLTVYADALDCSPASAEDIIPRLAAAQAFGVGVPAHWGGSNGSAADVVELIAAVAEHSLTAAFVLWGQRTFIEYLLHMPDHDLRAALLPDLLTGKLAGASGLSNAMKFLSGVEELQVNAEAVASGFQLSGHLPWVTNLRKQGFIVACAVDHGASRAPSIFAVPQTVRGLVRSDDLALIGLRSSNTAALTLHEVELGESFMLHPNAPQFLSAVRPTFLAFQTALAVGLARASLNHTRRVTGSARSVLANSRLEQERWLELGVRELTNGLQQGQFATSPACLFALRLRLIEVATASVGLELMAQGGRAYLSGSGGFARRWREACFLPIVTPSVVQLRAELVRHAVQERA